jgi:branched-chain amino acid aminotransferase
VSAATFSAIYFGGRFLSPSDPQAACVPISDRGYLLGEGVFATLRGYEGVCFRAARHLATLERGAKAFGMASIDVDRIAELVDEAAARTTAADAYVRVTLTQGASAHVLSILARSMDLPTMDEYERGIPVTIVGARRIPPECMDPTVKTTSYASSLLARREAELRGAREGLQLAIDGSLACGTMANVFLIEGETLRTPALASGCRAGVTREAVLEVATRAGMRVREERIDPGALREVDEAFLTSTRVECLPIASVDGRAIGRSRHPRTAMLRDALRRLVYEETRARRDRAE